eukprot:11362671-Alexandrium_andersonii.AAC.1
MCIRDRSGGAEPPREALRCVNIDRSERDGRLLPWTVVSIRNTFFVGPVGRQGRLSSSPARNAAQSATCGI